MSEDIDPVSDQASNSPSKSAPRTRRTAVPRAKKTAKTAVSVAAEFAEAITPPEEPSHAPTVTANEEWPEPEGASIGGATGPSENAKRKRRRRKGKGQAAAAAIGISQQEVSNTSPTADSNDALDEAPAPPQLRPVVANPQLPKPPQSPQNAPQRLKIDPEFLTKMAWKIYLAEISEEGVALIGDNDAKELSRRCFRLAEIFIEEQSRRR